MADRPLDVALVVEHFTPSRGGGERYVADLARGLLDRGHRVTVYAAEHEPVDPRLTIRTVPAPRHPKWLRKWRFATGSRAALAGGHDVVHAVGKALGFTLLNPHGGVEADWLRQHLRAYAHPLARAWATLRRYGSPRHWVLMAIERRQYASPHLRRVVAISDLVAGHIRARYPAVPADRVTVLYNGVDLDRFHPGVRAAHRAATRARWGLRDDELACLFVGNNFRLKGVANLVRAVALARQRGVPARAVVVGREPPGRLAVLAARLGVAGAVAFPGPEPAIERAYAGADLFVHPTWFDACALVTFEAMACGLPVVTTRWNGAAGLVRDGVDGAVLADPGDADALAAAIARLAPPDARAAAGAAARTRIEAHPASENFDRIVEVYRGLTAEHM